MNGVCLQIQQLISTHGLVRAAELFARSQVFVATPEGEPALSHLENVHRFTRAAGLSKSYCAVAWLHDVPANGTLSSQEVETGFGIECATLLQAITVAEACGDDECRERQLAQLQRCPWAVDLKLADMLAHVACAIDRRHLDRLTRYCADHERYAAIFRQGNRTLFAQLQSRMARAEEVLRAPPVDTAAPESSSPEGAEKDYYRGKNLPSWVREVIAKRGQSDSNPYLEMLRKKAG